MLELIHCSFLGAAPLAGWSSAFTRRRRSAYSAAGQASYSRQSLWAIQISCGLAAGVAAAVAVVASISPHAGLAQRHGCPSVYRQWRGTLWKPSGQ